MENLVKGDIVVIPFPFSDLSNSKRRPALVISSLEGDDVILCQITHKLKSKDPYSVELLKSDLESGYLPVDSYIRPNRLFTGDTRTIIKKGGRISKNKLTEVTDKLIKIITS